MTSRRPRLVSAWLVGVLALVTVAVLLHDPAGPSVTLMSIAALAVAAVVVWSFPRPVPRSPYGSGRRVPMAAHLLGPTRSSHPDAAGRPRPRAPGV